MKLRTELLHTWHLGKPKDYVYYKKITDVEHDALATHALLQAIDEAFSEWETYGAPTQRSIEQRADELMREWTGQ